MKNVIDKIMRIEEYICAMFFVAFFICVLLQILTRYVPFIKVNGTEDISVYSFIWSTFLGAAVMTRKKQHFSFTYFNEKAEGTLAGLIINLVIQALIIIFGIYIAYYGTELTMKFSKWTLTSLPNVSQGWTWSALMAGGISITIFSIANFIEVIQDYKKKGDTK
jgi:TRAP-type C4-dicarboxylate transport system permease small subunit